MPGPQADSEPVVRALGGLIVAATASFALSVAAVLATIFAVDGQVHWIAHLSLPGLMVLVIAGRAAYVLRRHRTPHDDAWARAREVDAFDTRLAQVLSVAVPLAWLVGSAAIVVRHWMDFQGLAIMAGMWLPLAAMLWILATFAWVDACRDRIATGLDESDRRFRAYWQDIGQAR